MSSYEQINGKNCVVGFNQDYTEFFAASNNGFLTYDLKTDVKRLCERKGERLILFMERLYQTSLVAIVYSSDPKVLKLYNLNKPNAICQLLYDDTILGIKMNQEKFVVCLKETLHIHNMNDTKLLHSIVETPPNPEGIFAFSVAIDNSYLAYPSSITGAVEIFNATHFQSTRLITTDGTPLRAMAINLTGELLATAGESGKFFYVFSIATGVRLWQLTRGISRSVEIVSLTFSFCSEYLASTSDTKTVHIFKLELEDIKRLTCKTAIEYFASYVSDLVQSINVQRSHATVSIKNATTVRRTCAIKRFGVDLKLFIGSDDGYLYEYLITQAGGDCTRLHKHNVHIDEDDSEDGFVMIQDYSKPHLEEIQIL